MVAGPHAPWQKTIIMALQEYITVVASDEARGRSKISEAVWNTLAVWNTRSVEAPPHAPAQQQDACRSVAGGPLGPDFRCGMHGHCATQPAQVWQ